jgi:hypothetical protein
VAAAAPDVAAAAPAGRSEVPELAAEAAAQPPGAAAAQRSGVAEAQRSGVAEAVPASQFEEPDAAGAVARGAHPAELAVSEGALPWA